MTARTPPTFLFHTNDDTGVPPENSVLFYLALRKAGVPAELHIYEQGRHGVGLAPKDPVLSTWPDRLAAWLKAADCWRRNEQRPPEACYRVVTCLMREEGVMMNDPERTPDPPAGRRIWPGPRHTQGGWRPHRALPVAFRRTT